ncbi:protein mobD [Xenophilus sp. AP218F]|nr:protein mobD [Xenophilus sp. AP218F]
MASIFMIAGGKGGVGKTITGAGMVDTLQSKGRNILLIETDTSNPDVYKMYGESVSIAELIDLDNANGWIDLVNICDQHRDHDVVINTGARNEKGVVAYGETLSSTLAEMNRKLITLWVINRQRDSVELLKKYMEYMPESVTHVIRNGYYGDELKFELYNNSKTREAIEKNGGKSLLFPDLADRVSDDLYSKRLSIEAAMQSLPLGNRAELGRWRKEVHRVLAGILDE